MAKKVQDDKEQNERNETKVGCRSRRLVKLIAELNDVQRESINRIGFGGVLQLRLKRFPLRHLPLFLEAFNDGSHMFRASKKREFLLTKHDVHDCFMLPLGPKEIEKVPTGRSKSSSDEEFKSLKDRWRNAYDVKKVSDPIKLGKILSDLSAEENKDGGDQFCRLFVLFCMSSFLCPTSNNGVDIKLLKAVEDVSSISQYDWCSYVLDGTVSAALEYRNSPAVVLGCIPFLMVTYFQRFDFPGAVLPHDLPLIMHWDEEKISARLEGELKSGSLGRQPWSSVKYPRCLQLPTIHDVKFPPPLSICGNSPSKAQIPPEKKSIVVELAAGVEDDQDLHARAVDGVHELYLQIQRNAIAFHDWYTQAISKIKQLTTETVNSLDIGPSQSTQAFFEDPKLHAYCDEVVRLMMQMKESTAKAPVLGGAATARQDVDLYSPSKVSQVITDLRSDGFLGEDVEEGPPVDVDMMDKDPNRVEDNMRDVVEGVDKLGSDLGGGEKQCTNDGGVITGQDFHKYLLHSSVPLSCMDIVPDNLGCTINCGDPNGEQLVTSQVLLRDKSIFSNVLSLRKEVMDFVFNKSDTVNKLETLVSFSDCYVVPREEMWSLEPGVQITNAVIDSWCILLNQLMYEKSAPVNTSRCFFSTSHSGIARKIWDARNKGVVLDVSKDFFATWDMWIAASVSPFQLNSDMVFLPSLSEDRDHYSCACINFKSGQLEYLDNRSYDDDLAILPYAGLPRILADNMGDYLVSKGYQRGALVRGFPLVNIPFRWQGITHSRNDCGFFMMIHMLLYRGENFDLFHEGSCLDLITLYRAEIAATLVLSDINKEREAVLASLTLFKNTTGQSSDPSTLYQTPVHPSGQKRGNSSPPQNQSTKRRRSTTNPSTAIKTHPRGHGDGLGCTLDCGGLNPSLLLISKTMRANQALLKDLTDLRKQVVDYCFLDDPPPNLREMKSVELMACYGNHAMLDRDDIISMLPDNNTSPSVIQCWSMLLNRIESDENETPRMFFFGMSDTDDVMALMENFGQPTPNVESIDSLYRIWDQFIEDNGPTVNLNADLLFLPLKIDDHFVCICINFKSNTIDILDHMTYSDWKKSDVFKASQVLTSAMSDYLDGKGVSKASDIPSETRKIQLKWQSSTPNNPESALFTMMHMLLYEGAPFDHPDLHKRIGRRYLVVQLAATLILADMNSERTRVLKKVKTFAEDKSKIWDEVYAKRKIKKILAKN